MSPSPMVYILFFQSCLSFLTGASNVTTIFRLEQTSAGVYEQFGSWGVIARGSARGFPLRQAQHGINNVWAGQPCCESWAHDRWKKLDNNDAGASDAPLDKQPLTSAESSNLESVDSMWHFRQDSSGVWRGPLPSNARARMAFTPPETGRAALGVFLCETEGVGDTQCVAIVLTGGTADGKMVRYQATRYGSRESGSRRPTPNGYLKTYVIKRDDRVKEGWVGSGRTYRFSIERSSQGDLEVRLEGGDPGQRRSMTIAAGEAYGKLAVGLLPGGVSDGSRLEVSEDTSWRSDLLPGGSVQVSYQPTRTGAGHLGLALCEDRFQEKCVAKVFDGFSDHSLISDPNDTPFWIAGNHEAQSDIPDRSATARWAPVKQYVFTLNRDHDGQVLVRLKDDERASFVWKVPNNYQYFIVDSYHNEGTTRLEKTNEGTSSSVWKLTGSIGELRSPPIQNWFVEKDVCVSVVARVGEGSSLIVSVQRYKADETKTIGRINGSSEATWTMRRLVIPPSLILQNQVVQIVLTCRQPSDTNTPVLVQWAAGCDPDRDEDKITLKGYLPPTSIIGKEGFRTNLAIDPVTEFLKPTKHPVCANEGLLDLTGKCICRPGFAGKVCERGCGPNRFGEGCQSKCSDDFAARQCRGMWLCVPNHPCDCAPGLSGPRCDKVCERGKWGIGCRQTCGLCDYDQPCDPYTGVCTTGCKGPLQPPRCKEECGRKFTGQALIGNGLVADAERYPWHVGVFDARYSVKGAKSNETSIENICGGTLLTPTIVVSAAHCFYDEGKFKVQPADKYKVALGKNKRLWEADEKHNERVQKRNVAVIHIPEDYRGKALSYENDIALLELDVPVSTNEYVIPICFDNYGGFEQTLLSGSVGYVAGWGRTEKGVSSDVLKEARLPFVSRSDCLQSVPFSFLAYAGAKDKFCAGEREDAYVDKGDSGGGLVFSQRGVWYLRGIVSVGPPSDLSYTAYTNVTYHRDWINQFTNQADLRLAITKYWDMQHN